MANNRHVLDRQFGFCANRTIYNVTNNVTELNPLVNNLVHFTTISSLFWMCAC